MKTRECHHTSTIEESGQGRTELFHVKLRMSGLVTQALRLRTGNTRQAAELMTRRLFMLTQIGGADSHSVAGTTERLDGTGLQAGSLCTAIAGMTHRRRNRRQTGLWQPLLPPCMAPCRQGNGKSIGMPQSVIGVHQDTQR